MDHFAAVRRIASGPVTVLLLALIGYASVDATLTGGPASTDPDFIDLLLASDSVLAAVRMAIIAASTYLVLSVVALITRRQWLTRVGPVEVSEHVSEVLRENAALKRTLADVQQTSAQYEQELRQLTDRLAGGESTMDEPDG